MSEDATVSASMRCICEYAVCAESGLRRMMLRVCEGCLGLVVLTQQQKFDSFGGGARSVLRSVSHTNMTCLVTILLALI